MVDAACLRGLASQPGGSDEMFEKGDPVVHPVRGAGIVRGFEKLRRKGRDRLYYIIELLGLPDSSLMIPVKQNGEETKILRPPISESNLRSVWEVLSDEPQTLPSAHKTRHKMVEDKLHTGDIMKTAEAVRDMAWREHTEKGLTSRGKRIYERGITLLSAELAAAQGLELTDAQTQIQEQMKKSFASHSEGE
jgi:RNA polymerase-interacting CarD/CdnL/TRCF family regulator